MAWRLRVLLSCLVGLACQTRLGESFARVPHRHRRPTNYSRWVSRTVRSLSEDPTQQPQQQEVAVNSGAVNGDNEASSSGLILQSDAKSQLFASFAALSLSDQYDAVLTGLCAKILDSSTIKEQEVLQAMEDPLNLIDEMNEKRIPASARSLMALVDSAVKTQDATTMAKVLTKGRRNSGILEFGALQGDVMDLPSNPFAKVKCPDGLMKTRAERLESVRDVPVDDRGTEVASALAFVAFAGACELTNLAHWDEISTAANLLLGLVVVVGVLVNFYDLIKSASGLAARQIDNDMAKEFDLPEKESLPLGLGSGKATGRVVRGLTRLVTIDPQREALCEAAALFVAYSLALPCFAFRSNALEASVLAVESRDAEELDTLLSSNGIMRLLIWLMAPVAAESARYPVCIISDPREASGFLERLESLAQTDSSIANELWWLDNTQERADLLKWAYTEADLLIRENRKVVDRLAERLEGGAATVGDCVALLEGW